MDKTNGYEKIAKIFIKHRGNTSNNIGALAVRNWSQTLPKRSCVLDIGCGMGIPISKVLIDEGKTVYGIDSSITMIKEFKQNFPNAFTACESVEDSFFFNRKFDGIIAWGLMFLLSKQTQEMIIQKSANALKTGGKLLFTAPKQEVEWKDNMTGKNSVSLGSKNYKKLLSSSGLSLIDEFEDEGDNHYFSAIKV